MRIELRDERRQRMGRIEVDPALRPTRVTVEAHHSLVANLRHTVMSLRNGGHAQAIAGRAAEDKSDSTRSQSGEVFLNWETAVDDAGQLRRCVACGCTDLFREKSFPQVTGFVVLLAFIGAIVGALGLATNLPVLFAMAAVLVLDIAILVFSRRRLVCYQCRTTYFDLPIARYHGTWDRAIADRHPLPTQSTASAEPEAGAMPSPVLAGAAQARSQKGSLA